MMEDDACREDVTNGVAFGAHISNIDDLWGNKARSSTPNKEILFFFGKGGEAKVANG